MTTHRQHHTGQQMSHDMEQCIANCQECHATCLETVTYCLQKGGRHAEMEHVRLLLDCADICQTSADFMLRGSDRHQSTCRLCAEICARCAEDCERFGDDEQMRRCAEVCRRCSESCFEMAGMTMRGV